MLNAMCGYQIIKDPLDKRFTDLIRCRLGHLHNDVEKLRKNATENADLLIDADLFW